MDQVETDPESAQQQLKFADVMAAIWIGSTARDYLPKSTNLVRDLFITMAIVLAVSGPVWYAMLRNPRLRPTTYAPQWVVLLVAFILMVFAEPVVETAIQYFRGDFEVPVTLPAIEGPK